MIYYCILNNGEDEHAAAYALLAYGLKRAGIYEYTVKKEDGGRPFIPGDPAFFSVTHTKGFCAVVISDKRTGIDAEHSERRLPQKIAERVFTADERSSSLAPMQLWTIKEAASKVSGKGMAQILGGIELDTAAMRTNDGCYCRLYETDGYMIAVCEKGNITHELCEVKSSELVSYL